MEKTRKELAFLRDLYVTPDWTRRFAELTDKHLNLEDTENILYLNAGTGDHCFAIREKLDDKTAVFGRCENEDLMSIARDKAIAVRSDVDFSTMTFDDDSFDAVIADASLLLPRDVDEYVEEAVRVAKTGAHVTFFLPSAGSFGEVFSLLWELFFDQDIGDHGHEAENMINEQSSVSSLRSKAEAFGLSSVKTETSNETFEFEDGSAFMASPLVDDFLMPHWLETLDENEKEQVREKLAQLIDSEDGNLSFRFSVKATVVTGKKV